MAVTHELKTVNPYFNAAWKGKKGLELRFNDRYFRKKDQVLLREYDAASKAYSGREIMCEITFVLTDFPGLEKGFVIFSFHKIHQMIWDASAKV